MNEQFEKCVSFLRSMQADGLPHSERGLLDHLIGTRQLLIEWGARDPVCDAGLFHSVYGTEHYEPKALPLSMRADVRQLIGDEAESLAWLFCMMRRDTFDQNLDGNRELSVQHRLTAEWIPLTTAQYHDLVTMTFANTLEATPRLSWNTRRNCRVYLRPFRSIAIAGAQRAFDSFDTQWWKFWK